ncbi:MAG: bifunctional tetrahydrofolate synthase/dihydrofolate synthase [Saccharospirillum sp.]
MSQPPESAVLQDWLSWLEHLHSQEIDLGLDRLAEVAGRLSLPLTLAERADGPFVFTVAGTNGKGSTCAALQALAMEAGVRVGLYSSPHLVRFNERVLINGIEASDAQLVAAFRQVEAVRQGVSLTYFEFTTLAALVIFAQSDLAVWVLEVGLGGRLDAVNLVDADCAVVTTVGLDHQGFLGDTLEQIGFEKAGVFRAGQPAVLGSDDLPESVAGQAAKLGARLQPYGATHGIDHGQLHWGRGQQIPVADLTATVPLANQATAAQAFSLSPFSLPADRVRAALNRVVLAGRCQRVDCQGRILVLDVGHNPHAATYLAGYLGSQRWHLVLGMLADKDAAGVAAALRPLALDVSLVTLDVPRGLTAEALQQKATLTDARCYDSMHEALASVMACEDQAPVLVCGSFYTVAAALAFLQSQDTRVTG